MLAKAQQYVKDKFNGEIIEYIDTKSKATFKCNNNHTFTKSYNQVRYGFWCNECRKILNYNKIKNIIESKQGKCLFSEYVDHASKYNIQCKNNHLWSTTYTSIVRQNTWCPQCSGSAKLSIDIAKNIAKERKGECLSNEYKDLLTKLEWKCNYNHKWKANLNSVKNVNSWCPYCNVNTGEEITRNIMELLFEDKFIRCRPKWLNGLELDGYCESKKIAFEYDGKQHFEFIKMFHQNQEGFEDRLMKDKQKNELCEMNHIILLRIPYNVKFDEIKSYIINKSEEKNLIVPKKEIEIDYKTFINIYTQNDDKYEELKKIVESKGVNIIDKKYVSSKSKIKLKCKNMHEWETTPHDIKNKRRICFQCPYCSKKKKYTLEEMHKLAKEHEGYCLSNVYVNNKTKLKWECKQGHIWETQPSLILKGCWCAICNNLWNQKKKVKTINTLTTE